MSAERRFSPVSIVVLVVVAIVAGYLFSQLHQRSTSPEAAGAADVGADAVTNGNKLSR